MGKILDADLTSFPKNDGVDRQTVMKLGHLLNQTRAKSDIYSSDKFPNIDGRISLASAEGMHTGEIQVQVKTLKTEHQSDPRYQCDKWFLKYCHKVFNPVLLIVVSKDEDSAYWIHITKELVEELDKKISGDSIVVYIPKVNIITKQNQEYIEQWQKIIDIADKVIFDHREMVEKFSELKEIYIQISNSSENSIPEEDKEVTKELQVYLDLINSIWDNEFNILKSFIYPNVWKFGVGYCKYSSEAAITSTYPIFYGNVLLPILKFPNEDALSEAPLYKMYYWEENYIKKAPIEFAYSNIEEDIMPFLSKNTLLSNNKQIAIEFIFSFINEYHYLMELELKAEYTIDDIVLAIHKPLLENCHKIASRHKELVTRTRVFDMDSIKHHILKDDLDGCLKLTFVKQENLRVISGKFNVITILRLLSSLKNQGINSINSIYSLRARKFKDNMYYLEPLSQIQVHERIKIAYSLFEKTYRDIVSSFFPKIEQKLEYFAKFDYEIIILSKLKERADSLHFFRFESIPKNYVIKVLFEDDFPFYLKPLKLKAEEFEYDGRKLKVAGGCGFFDLRRVNLETPLKDLIHIAIRDKLQSYFEQKKSGLKSNVTQS